MRSILVLALLAGCVAPSPPPADPTPTPGAPCDLRGSPAVDLVLRDVAADRGAQDVDGVNNGIAAEDFDGDGDIDLYLANPGPRDVLLLQGADGRFVEAPSAPQVAGAPAASAVDFDDDGDVDLYVSCGGWSAGCASHLFRNDGVGADGAPSFSDVTQAMGLYDPIHSNFGGAWADYDGDGDLDLFQGSKSLRDAPDVPSQDQLWRNDGDVFVEVAAAAGVDSSLDSHQAVWLDYDADGWPDLFVPVLAGPNILYHNLGDGTFEDATPPALRQPIVAFAALALDVNQDGFSDLLVSGRSMGEHDPGGGPAEHGLFINDGAGGFEDWTVGAGLNDPGDGATHIATMGLQGGDLDLDGFPDVIFGNGDPFAGAVNSMGSFVPDGDFVRWVDRSDLIDGAGQGLGAGMPPYPFRTHGIVMEDLDGDGDVDLYLGDGGGPDAEPNQLWDNQSVVRNHALRLSLEGVTSNRRGIGARVRVSDGPEGSSSWAVYRTIEASSGFNSSRPATVTIGLGACSGPYHVTVQWPGAAEESYLDVPESAETTVLAEG